MSSAADSNAPTHNNDNDERIQHNAFEPALQTIRDNYYHLLFGIPFLYQNRFQRIIDTAHLSDSDLKLLMALNARNRGHARRGRPLKDWLKAIETLEDWDGLLGPFPLYSMKLKLNPNADEVTPVRGTIPLPGINQPGNGGGGRLVLTAALETFHQDWKTFIKSASYEWTTLNILSALLLAYVHNLAQARP